MADNLYEYRMPSGFTPYSDLIGNTEAETVLVALSGGADSRALFDLTAEYCEKKDLFFYAAHVNHGIRGAEAIRDRDFCMALAKDCPRCKDIFVLDADVPLLAKAPGYIMTDMMKTVPEDLLQKFAGLTMLGRLGQPEEIAKAALFLASDDSSYVTGHVLSVNGGRRL